MKSNKFHIPRDAMGSLCVGNPAAALSDCCEAPADGPLDPSKTLPGKAYGCCSECLLPAVFNSPCHPESRSPAGLLIGVAMALALVAGGVLMLGHPWVAGLLGVTVAGLLVLAYYRQTP